MRLRSRRLPAYGVGLLEILFTRNISILFWSKIQSKQSFILFQPLLLITKKLSQPFAPFNLLSTSRKSKAFLTTTTKKCKSILLNSFSLISTGVRLHFAHLVSRLCVKFYKSKALPSISLQYHRLTFYFKNRIHLKNSIPVF